MIDTEKVTDAYTKPYTGEMYHVVNRHIDLLCMPGTRIIARVRPHTRAKMSEKILASRAETIKSSWQLQMPVCGIYPGMLDVLPSMAYSAGHWCSNVLREDAVAFDNDTVAALHEHIDDRDFSAMVTDEQKRLIPEFLKAYPDRNITWEMLRWTIEARKQLFYGLMDGNASQYEGANVYIFLSTRENRNDIFQAIAMSIGWRAHMSYGNGVFVTDRKQVTTVYYKHKRHVLNWEGDVWNLRTDTGRIIVRRNYKIAIVSTL